MREAGRARGGWENWEWVWRGSTRREWAGGVSRRLVMEEENVAGVRKGLEIRKRKRDRCLGGGESSRKEVWRVRNAWEGCIFEGKKKREEIW